MHTTDQDYFEFLKNRGIKRQIRNQLFLKTIAKHLSGNVLDVGCGAGGFLQIYSQQIQNKPNTSIRGMDINSHAIAFCKSLGFECYLAPVNQIPFPDESFDGVLLSHVLEHLEQSAPVMEEIMRVLKPGGVFCVMVPGKAAYDMDDTGTHRIFYDKPLLEATLIKHGFQVIKMTYFPFPFRRVGDYLYINELRAVCVKQCN